MTNNTFLIPTISNNGNAASVFSVTEIAVSGDPLRLLSEQQACENFRLRQSLPDFASEFHVAGDPTLLVVLTGCIRIELRHGEYRDFSSGQMFIAEDYLAADVDFDATTHGHRAEVVGDDSLQVLHLKLAKRS